MNDTESLVKATLLDLLSNGYGLVRIDDGAKAPKGNGWQLNPVRTLAGLHGADQVGIACGPLSAKAVCVDLDGVAIELADRYLPATDMEDGRPGSERTHRWYVLSDISFPDSVLPGTDTDIRRAMDAGMYPRFPGSRNLRPRGVAGVGVELKGAGTQAVVPPSMGKTGRRFWHGGCRGEPARVSYAELLTAVKALATAVGWKEGAVDMQRQTYAPAVLRLADWEVLARARGAKNGDKFQELWQRTEAKSEDDAALCGMLAFWSTDAGQVERLWLSSPCGARSKTQDRSDYRRRTLSFVLGAGHG